MPDSGKPSSWPVKLLRGSACLFAAVILIHLTIALIKAIWWVFLILGLIAAAIIAIRWWYRR